jgi:hypothetical protein
MAEESVDLLFGDIYRSFATCEALESGFDSDLDFLFEMPQQRCDSFERCWSRLR